MGVPVAVVGATGYTGCELVRILSKHRNVEITSLTALLKKEQPFNLIFPRYQEISLLCENLEVERVAERCELVFLALPHKVSMEIAFRFLTLNKKVIDLSADYRLPPEIYEKYYGVKHTYPEIISRAVYGLSELYREEIKKANLIANPGCYPTSVLLALAPLLEEVEVERIVIDSKTGLTGAGRKSDIHLNFCEVEGSVRAYKVNEHQHIPEIEEQVYRLTGKRKEIVFVPHIVPISRGILSTIYLWLDKAISQKEIIRLYEEFYRLSPFLRISGDYMPQIKDVLFTNICALGIKTEGQRVIIVSVLDNLVKGAAGQAVQNMNIIYGFEETEGLDV
ncbi:MAG: N-acetyl-gamma-glutamyl-phosphate reductase [Candidatus Omnitrophota bacterium]|nr:MAG: N-acetyl-gamma-glutamyl-phosphate reductase [Candidatus Omnitrophota bacterium]